MRRRGRIRPGKFQSGMGFIGGLLACIFGVAVVLPNAGLFGVIWTVVAVIITITNAINAFSDSGVATEIIEYEDADDRYSGIGSSSGSSYSANYSKSSSLSNSDDVLKRMETAKELYDKGMISYDEYEQKKTELLKKL